MRKTISLLLLLILSNLVAQKTTSTPFLLINPDARSAGMGDNGVATSVDAFAIYHNAAKTTFNKRDMSLSLNYTPWMRNLTEGIFFGGGSFVHRFDEKQAWGIDFKYFSLGDINLTDNLGASVGTENPNELALTGVYSMRLSQEFSMGVALKYFNSNYKLNSIDTNLNAVSSFAVDVSGFYESVQATYGGFDGKYRFGFNFANLGPKVSYTEGVENFIPANLKLGGGFDFILNDINILGTSLEFSKLLVPEDARSEESFISGIFSGFGSGGINFGIGAEYLYNHKFALRTGYFNEGEGVGDRQYVTLGAGFKQKTFSIDLSYLANTSNVNNPLENTLRFSLAFDFGNTFGGETSAAE